MGNRHPLPTPKPFLKGRAKTGGRIKGTKNKVTLDVQQGLKLIAERGINKLEKWIEQAAKKDPHRGADLFLRTLEFTQPKLNRTEHTPYVPPDPTQELPPTEDEAMSAYLEFVSANPVQSVTQQQLPPPENEERVTVEGELV